MLFQNGPTLDFPMLDVLWSISGQAGTILDPRPEYLLNMILKICNEAAFPRVPT